MSPVEWTNATLVERRDANARCMVVRVRPDAARVQPFVAGQFVQLGLPRPDGATTPDGRARLVKRSYSLASAPHEVGHWELCLAKVDAGQLTPRLFELRPGDRLWCDDAPKGHFTLERIPREAPLAMVATGTGIAPFVSMLRHLRHGGDHRPVAIVHGARDPSDLCYDAELRATECAYLPSCSRAGADWQGPRGRVQSVLERWDELVPWPLSPAGCHVLLCGNPAMIDEVRDLLLPRGFALDTAKASGSLHFERYW
jgi:ferredoxin--NADP+ reductase